MEYAKDANAVALDGVNKDILRPGNDQFPGSRDTARTSAGRKLEELFGFVLNAIIQRNRGLRVTFAEPCQQRVAVLK